MLLQYSFVRQIFDDDLMKHIVEQTNLYASQNPHARYNWKDLTVEKLQAFFGVILLAGITKKPELKDFWSTDPTMGQYPNITNAFPFI